MSKQEFNNPTLVRRRFYLEPVTMTYLDMKAQELGTSTSKYLDILVQSLIKREAN